MDENLIESRLNHLKKSGIIAILRGQNSDRLYQRGLALAEMGCMAIEVTLDSNDTLQIIKKLREKLPEEIMIGVGTMTNSEDATQCFDAGAEFALSPTYPANMIEQCDQVGLLAIPGVANTKELDVAIRDGAQIVKLFPSSKWSLEQLSSISIPWIPVGGIDDQNVWRWLDAGAWCVGMGTNLCGSDLNDKGAGEWADSEEQRTRGIFMELRRYGNPT